MSNEQEREAFEAWVTPCYPIKRAGGDGQYTNPVTQGMWAAFQAGREWGQVVAALAATPAPAPQPLTDEQIEGGRSKLFSVGNPYCPITEKAMRTAVRWAERAHGIGGDK